MLLNATDRKKVNTIAKVKRYCSAGSPQLMMATVQFRMTKSCTARVAAATAWPASLWPRTAAATPATTSYSRGTALCKCNFPTTPSACQSVDWSVGMS